MSPIQSIRFKYCLTYNSNPSQLIDKAKHYSIKILLGEPEFVLNQIKKLDIYVRPITLIVLRMGAGGGGDRSNNVKFSEKWPSRISAIITNIPALYCPIWYCPSHDKYLKLQFKLNFLFLTNKNVITQTWFDCPPPPILLRSFLPQYYWVRLICSFINQTGRHSRNHSKNNNCVKNKDKYLKLTNWAKMGKNEYGYIDPEWVKDKQDHRGVYI